MGKYLQILLTRNYDMPPISNCSIMHIQYGCDGWIEQIDNNYKGYRFIRQSHIDKHTIMQIVEEMEDGWVPSQILLKDTVFNTVVSTNELITENIMGWWNRKIMEIPPIQLEALQDEPVHLERTNQHRQIHNMVASSKKQPALLPTPAAVAASLAAPSSYKKSNSKNEYSKKYAKPSSYNNQYTPLKAHHKNQSSPIPLIPLIGISAKHYSISQDNRAKHHL